MKTYFALGLMSGTSLDGLDLCYAKFTLTHSVWNFEIITSKTVSYPDYWTEKLKNSILLSAVDLLSLHSEYGFYLGEKISEFIYNKRIKNLDLIASHGHTVHHQPDKNFTCQIGDGRAIKLKNDYPVVYDFRSQDVIMGGNGAPLVPVGDKLLFSEYHACLNLGGFSNISFNEDDHRIAFDISPLNIVLNSFAEKLGHKFDEDGKIAAAGIINNNLLEKLNKLGFYNKKEPKSLGLEFVKEQVLPILINDSDENIIATFTEHAAVQTAKVLNDNHLANVLLTGGGIFNSYLIKTLRTKTETKLIIPTNEIINFKEALIFAFMGVLKFRGENNVLCSATGSSEDHSSGLIV